MYGNLRNWVWPELRYYQDDFHVSMGHMMRNHWICATVLSTWVREFCKSSKVLGHARIRLAFRPDGLCRSSEDLTIQEVWSDMVGVVAHPLPNIYFDPTFLIWKAFGWCWCYFSLFHIFQCFFFGQQWNDYKLYIYSMATLVWAAQTIIHNNDTRSFLLWFLYNPIYIIA